MASGMSLTPDVPFGIRVAESVALLACLGAAPLLKAPSPPQPTNGHSEITTVVRAVKVPRRQLIVFLLSAVALTALADGLVTLANALFKQVIETALPVWRGLEFYSVALVVAFVGFALIGGVKEARGVPFWQSKLLKLFVLIALVFDFALAVLIPLTSDWSEDPNPHVPEKAPVGIAPIVHLCLIVLRVLILLALLSVLFVVRTSYEPVGQNGSAPSAGETSRLVPSADAGSAEASAGLASPKAKYGTFDHAPPPADETPALPDTNKRDHGEVPGYSVDTPVDLNQEAHILPVPAVDTPDNMSIVPTESGAVGLGPGPQIVPVEQLVAATVQSDHPAPVKPEEQPASEQPSEVKPDVSFAAVAAGEASASKSEPAPAPVEPTPAPKVEPAAPIAFPQSESKPIPPPAPISFPKSDDESAPDSSRPAMRETTSGSSNTAGISFAPGTDGERVKQAAQRFRKISQGAAAKSQQSLARLARKMSVGPGPKKPTDAAGVQSENPVPVKPEDQPSSDQPSEVKPDVSFAAVASAEPASIDDSAAPQPESTASPLSFPKSDDDASLAGSARPGLRETTSSGSATPNISFAPGTDGERAKQVVQRFRKISQGAAAKSQQGFARLARRISQTPSRQASISSSINVASPPGSPGFMHRDSGSIRQSMDTTGDDKKKDKKDKRKSND